MLLRQIYLNLRNTNNFNRSQIMAIKVKPASDCKYDLVSLGEVMLRLDPGDGRIRTARSFQIRYIVYR